MIAALKSAVFRITGKLRIIILQMIRLHILKIQRGKSRRVHKKGILSCIQEFHVTGCILAARNLSGELAGFHLRPRAQKIDQRRFSCAGGAGDHRCSAPQNLPHRIHRFRISGADEQETAAAISIHLLQLTDLIRNRKILLVKAKNGRNSAKLHGNQKAIQHVAAWSRIGNRKQ